MDDFVRTIDDDDAKESLAKALSCRKPFGSFKDRLFDFPLIRDKWFAYHTERMNEIAREWLDENDIEWEELDVTT